MKIIKMATKLATQTPGEKVETVAAGEVHPAVDALLTVIDEVEAEAMAASSPGIPLKKLAAAMAAYFRTPD